MCLWTLVARPTRCKGSCVIMCACGRHVHYLWTRPAGKVAGPEPQTRHSFSWFGSACVELLSRGGFSPPGLSPPFTLRFSSQRGSYPAHITESTKSYDRVIFINELAALTLAIVARGLSAREHVTYTNMATIHLPLPLPSATSNIAGTAQPMTTIPHEYLLLYGNTVIPCETSNRTSQSTPASLASISNYDTVREWTMPCTAVMYSCTAVSVLGVLLLSYYDTGIRRPEVFRTSTEVYYFPN